MFHADDALHFDRLKRRHMDQPRRRAASCTPDRSCAYASWYPVPWFQGPGHQGFSAYPYSMAHKRKGWPSTRGRGLTSGPRPGRAACGLHTLVADPWVMEAAADCEVRTVAAVRQSNRTIKRQ